MLIYIFKVYEHEIYLYRCCYKSFGFLEVEDLEGFHGSTVTHQILILNNNTSEKETRQSDMCHIYLGAVPSTKDMVFTEKD